MVSSVIGAFGEGVIMRDPNSTYQCGRSDDIRKLKTGRLDTEALVVDLTEEAVRLKLPTGIIVSTKHEATPSITAGDLVTFSYAYTTKDNIPVDIKIKHVRHDISWPELMRHDHEHSSEEGDGESDAYCTSNLSTSSLIPLGTQLNQALTTKLYHQAKPRKEYGFWTHSESRNIKEFLDLFAKSRGMNPLLPESWYQVTQEEFLNEEGGVSVLKHYGGSVSKAVMDIYPSIGIQPIRFSTVGHNFWKEYNNRREFFEHFAKVHGFDPLKPNNWYHIAYTDLAHFKGAIAITRYYPSYVDAIIDTFPDIGLAKNRFHFKPRNFYQVKMNRKLVFDELAHQLGIDPLLSQHWYSKTPTTVQVERIPGGSTILRYYKFNIPAALADLYPNVSSNATNPYLLGTPPRSRPSSMQFFNEFAKHHGFNPRLPSNWYNITSDDIAQAKGLSVLRPFGNSLSAALLSTYPDIGLSRERFRIIPRHHWSEEHNRKAFFDSVASRRHFDPLLAHHWYQLRTTAILSYKGGRSLLAYFHNSLAAAIMDTYPSVHFDANCFVS